MNQWTFVLAAYALVTLATAGLIAWAWRSMHIAEADVDAVKRRP